MEQNRIGKQSGRKFYGEQVKYEKDYWLERTDFTACRRVR